jgi:uncharacterized protein YciI
MEPETWFTLEHSPGPAWSPGVATGEQDLSEHFAFISMLAERGLLVGAGPRPDKDGHGMTIIRGVDADEARRLATEVDNSVVHGLLVVTIRPWLVVVS